MKRARAHFLAGGPGLRWSPLALFTGAAGGFYDVSDLSTLFQDSAATTPVTAAGQPVGRVNDKSGNGNHLLQATAGKRPTYQTGGGLAWLDFDGVDDALVMTSAATWDDMLAMVGARHTAGITVFDIDTTTGNTSALRWANTGVTYVAANGAQATAAPPTFGNDGLAGGSIVAATNSGTAHINGDDAALTPAGGAATSAFKRLAIGGQGGGVGNFAACRFYRGCVLGRQGSAAEKARLRTWVGAGAGLAL